MEEAGTSEGSLKFLPARTSTEVLSSPDLSDIPNFWTRYRPRLTVNHDTKAKMMQGHYGAAMIISGLSHRAAPLPALFLSSQAQDFLIAVFAYLIHIEETRLASNSENRVIPFELVYIPYSHSLFTSLLLALLALLFFPGSPPAKRAVAAAVFSHWLVDLLVHLPDLDICFPFFDCGKAGFALWRYLVPSLAAECAFILVGYVLYIRTAESAALARTVRLRLLPLVLFMIVVTVTMPLAPPPSRLDWTITLQTYVSYGLLALVARFVERPLLAENGVERKQNE